MTDNQEIGFFDTQPMFVCDQIELTILDVNRVAEHVLGFTRKELIGKGLLDLGKRVHVETVGHNKLQSHVGFDSIWELKGKSGKGFTVQLAAHLMNYKGKPARLVIAHLLDKEVMNPDSGSNPISSQVELQDFPFGEIEWNADHLVFRWSKKAESIFGYAEEEVMLNKDFFDQFVHPEDQQQVQAFFKHAVEKKLSSSNIVNRNITKSGKVIYCEWYNSILYDQQGNIASTYSIVQDVTEREKATREAQNSMISYRDLFNSISDSIYLLNEDGEIIEMNHGLEKTYGYTRKEVLGERFSKLNAPGKVDVQQVLDTKSLVDQGESVQFEGWARKKNGEVFPTETLVNLGSYNNQKVYIVIERDISDRNDAQQSLKHREQLFRELFNSSPIGIALLNKHREIELVNAGFQELFGYKFEEIKGLELDKVIVPEPDKEHAYELSKTTSVVEFTGKRKTKSGKMIDVIIYGIPVVVDGKTVAVYGIYVDITDRENTERKMRDSLKEKEVLLAEIHHRVKNNLAVITGLLELQAFRLQSEIAKKAIKDSQMRVNSIALVHEKLYQSESLSNVQVQEYFVELSEIIKSAMSNTTPVNIHYELEEIELPVTHAIPCGLILNEIVTNSFKHAFSGREEGEIWVSFKQQGDMVELRVADNGIGVDPGLVPDRKKSLGMTLIHTLSRQLNAQFKMDTTSGTAYTLIFKKRKLNSSFLNQRVIR
ncbi:MAG: PAS domain S-box protein [Bacteroidota bacterium]